MFVSRGTTIKNPFREESGRFQVDPRKHYGFKEIQTGGGCKALALGNLYLTDSSGIDIGTDEDDCLVIRYDNEHQVSEVWVNCTYHTVYLDCEYEIPSVMAFFIGVNDLYIINNAKDYEDALAAVMHHSGMDRAFIENCQTDTWKRVAGFTSDEDIELKFRIIQ